MLPLQSQDEMHQEVQHPEVPKDPGVTYPFSVLMAAQQSAKQENDRPGIVGSVIQQQHDTSIEINVGYTVQLHLADLGYLIFFNLK